MAEPFGEITEVEKLKMHELADLLDGRYGAAWPALMRAQLDGRDVSVIVAVTPDPDGSDDSIIHPLAVMVDDGLFARLTPPDEVEEVDNPYFVG